jgi:hypothetical protein
MNRSLFVAVGLLLVVMSVSIGAQRGRRGGANANLGAPVATNTVLQNPEAYYGKQITISAGVERMVSKTAFLLDQWKMTGPHEVQSIGRPVLVVAPYLTNTLDHRNYLLVRGELLKLDTATVARVAADYKLDLGPDLWTEFHGQPMLLAVSVINSRYTELAKKPVAPPTAPELAMSEAMKTISPAFTALRAAAEDGKVDLVAQQTAKLQPAFSRTEAIWDDLGQASASQWARDAQDQITAIQHNAAQGNWDAAKYAATKLNQLCASCHTTFRDPQDDGTFRMRAGTY